MHEVWSGDELRAWLYLRDLTEDDFANMMMISHRAAADAMKRGISARDLTILRLRHRGYRRGARPRPVDIDRDRPTPEEVFHVKQEGKNVLKRKVVPPGSPFYLDFVK